MFKPGVLAFKIFKVFTHSVTVGGVVFFCYLIAFGLTVTYKGRVYGFTQSAVNAQSTATFPAGEKVTLTAKPCSDSVFEKWEGVTCEQGQKSKVCTFTMPGKANPAIVVNAKPVFTKKPVAPKWKRNL